MSKTHVKRVYSYFRYPAHINSYKTEQRAVEEIIEAGHETGLQSAEVRNRVKQRANPNGSKSSPTAYDDINFSNKVKRVYYD